MLPRQKEFFVYVEPLTFQRLQSFYFSFSSSLIVPSKGDLLQAFANTNLDDHEELIKKFSGVMQV